MHSNSRLGLAAALVALTALWNAPAQGQEPTHDVQQVVSANPFGLLLDLFNAEYERATAPTTTVGLGGSFGSDTEEDFFGNEHENRYFNADVFARYYPSGNPFEGWNFGVKVGVTHQSGWEEFSGSPDSSTNLGYGFDANRSWLLGASNNFYVGVGFGLKRLIGDVPQGAMEVVPTLRIINVGFAF